jgi:hypothetical protein
MTDSPARPRSYLFIALGSGMLVTLCWFLFSWRYGLDFGDEGYYWYGAQRVLRGEAPIRDFLAYDIGRYLWAAAVMALVGDDGIFTARAAAALYQALTVCVGVFLVLQAADRRLGTAGRILFALVTALILDLWAYPYYKVYDYGTSILLVAMLVLILSSLSPARWFGAGLLLGLAAVMGRNHGAYGIASALLALGFMLLKQGRRGELILPALAFIGGTVIGFSPTFAMDIFKPGFLDAFIAGVIEHVHSTATATNIPLPVPWPWTIIHGKYGWVLWAIAFAEGMAFIALLLVPVLTLVALLRKPLVAYTHLDYLLAAAAITGLIYAHYAYSRADLVHVALSIAPLIFIALGAGSLVRAAIPVAAGVLALSVLMLAKEAPVLNSKVLGRSAKTVRVNGSELYVPSYIARDLMVSEQVFSALPAARHNFLAVPNFPAFYAINKSRMAIWEIYALSARDAGFEAAELSRLAKAQPDVVILSNHALDHRPELRYSRMHPLMYQWIQSHYQRANLAPSSELEIYVKNTPMAGR